MRRTYARKHYDRAKLRQWETRESKASCWPEDRVCYIGGDWDNATEGQESGKVLYQRFSAFWTGTWDERERTGMGKRAIRDMAMLQQRACGDSYSVRFGGEAMRAHVSARVI